MQHLRILIGIIIVRSIEISESRINELAVLLKDKEDKFSLSVRAANAISILDRLTQDKGMKSHIRTMLWQVVSNLEGIRE